MSTTIDPKGNDLCFKVTPNRVTDEPCVQPGGDCIDVSGDTLSRPDTARSGAPPLPSLYDSDCTCNPMHLDRETDHIILEIETVQLLIHEVEGEDCFGWGR